MDASEYLGLFLDESGESLQALNASLLDLERRPDDPGPLTVIFRVAHSLKGMSAAMGFDAMARLTHRMEEVLAAMRDRGAPVTPAVSDALFACLDALQEMVDRVAASDHREVDAAAVMARLDAIASVDPGGRAPAATEAAATLAPPEAPAGEASEAPGRGSAVVRVAVTFDEGCRLAGARAFMVGRELAALGELIRSDPPLEEVGDDAGGVAFWVHTAADAGALRAAALGVGEVVGCDVAPVEAGRHGASRPAAPGSRSPGRAPATVRVGTDRLDALMELTGQMVVQRARLSRLAHEHDLGDLRAAADAVARITDDLQSLVLRVRMLPVEAVFLRFPRMVRDLAAALGKRVELVMSGGHDELDRAIVDGLADPLVHMLRNAVDHGLEPPAERRAAGKDPVGRVHLSARRTGDHVVIEVRDDGRGMDPAALRRHVVGKGLMSAREVAALADEQVLDLVFLPGFSTAATATDVSGRGVGLDAVRAAIAGLGGEVTVSGAPGRGSAFTISIPLALAIVPALLVSAGPGAPGRLHAIPLEAIEETLVAGRDDVRLVGGRPCLALRDRVLPLVRLAERLGGARRDGDAGERTDVVVVSAGGPSLALAVEAVVGTRELVVRRPPGRTGEVPGVAGAAVLGDGSMALVVDVAAVVAGATMPEGGPTSS